MLTNMQQLAIQKLILLESIPSSIAKLNLYTTNEGFSFHRFIRAEGVGWTKLGIEFGVCETGGNRRTEGEGNMVGEVEIKRPV